MIQFSGTGGTRGEELLRVPISAPGELTPQLLIRITVGMNPPTDADNDPTVGITDGVNRNQFRLLETTRTNNYIVKFIMDHVMDEVDRLVTQ